MYGPFPGIEDIPSRFQFVSVASRRARHLQAGAPAHIKLTSRNFMCIARLEGMAGLLDFIHVQPDGKPKPVEAAPTSGGIST